MKILFVRPGHAGFLSRLQIVQVEPLELEILTAVAHAAGWASRIFDGLIEGQPFRRMVKTYRPDVVAITGYITQQKMILDLAAAAKRIDPAIKVVVGGVHAQLNYRDFFHPSVDYIVHASGVRPFKELLLAGFAMPENTAGICYQSAGGSWQYNPGNPADPDEAPPADRSFFFAHQDRFNYLNLRPCAMIKTSFGCPHQCNFCYCRLLNGGRYLCRDLAAVVAEIADIPCENIWIVDDTFYIDPARITAFVSLIRENHIRKKFIVYYRADFIAANEELLVLLKSIGLVMVIVGLEACDDRQLAGYQKDTSAAVNAESLAVLEKNGIACTALFMVDIAADKNDFRLLNRFTRQFKLKLSTASILTPLPGTGLYAQYHHRLTTNDPRCWIFSIWWPSRPR